MTECLESGNSVSNSKMDAESPEILKSVLHRAVEPELETHVMSSFLILSLTHPKRLPLGPMF